MLRERHGAEACGWTRVLPPFWPVRAGLPVLVQTETQHGFDAGFRLSPQLDLVLHSRVRTQPGRSSNIPPPA